MNPIQIEVVKITANLVKIKLTENQRLSDVPRRVFDKRLELGMYEVQNPSAISKVI